MSDHPYVDFEKIHVWKSFERAISQLVGNHDLVEQTGRDYIIGYLCRAIEDGQQLQSLEAKF